MMLVDIVENISRYNIIEFVAIGGESIVFKATKENVKRTYALKFRTIDGWEDFNEFELECYKTLERCSVGKIAGVIPDVSSAKFREIYSMIPPNEIERAKIQNRIIDLQQNYFCVIEDYVPGCNLNDYCHIQKKCPSQNATYEDVIMFQKEIFHWMIQFSEIMMKVTEENRVLHLDIKPENIMLIPETKSLVLVDFGTSSKITDNRGRISTTENYCGDGYIGTSGFAAPEAYYATNQRPPYIMDKSREYVDERSDIFSFGATLWDCVTPNADRIGIRYTEEGYYRRDLFNTPLGYSQELEDIIIKCTEKNPEDRFQSFEELHTVAVEAEKKLPSIYKKNRLNIVFYFLSAVMLLLAVFVIFINVRSSNLAFEIAEYDFLEMVPSYNEAKIDRYREKSLALVKADPSRTDSYERILKVATDESFIIVTDPNANTVSAKEVTEVLVPCLREMKTVNNDIYELYANKIMERYNSTQLDSIAQAVDTYFGTVSSCPGKELANAYCNFKEDSKKSYDILMKYNNNEKTKGKYEKVIKAIANRMMNNSDVRDSLRNNYGEETVTELEKIINSEEKEEE